MSTNENIPAEGATLVETLFQVTFVGVFAHIGVVAGVTVVDDDMDAAEEVAIAEAKATLKEVYDIDADGFATVDIEVEVIGVIGR